MEARKTIEYEVKVYIDTISNNYYDGYVCSWKELLSVRDIKPEDKILGVCIWEHEQGPAGFGSMDDDYDEHKIIRTPVVRVLRSRPETDEEYSKRIKNQESNKKNSEEREWLEYLRLKAKYEK